MKEWRFSGPTCGAGGPITSLTRKTGRLSPKLEYGHIEGNLVTGLHADLTQFLDRAGNVGVGICRDFPVPMAA